MKKDFNKQEGFTLIELMIVVAIIGILAAIAIPQFASYRTKAFNSAAESDLHTARLAEESLYTDYQVYGGTANTGAAGTAAGVMLVSTNGVVATTTAGQEAPITLSNNVSLQAKTTATFDAATITSKHKNGDKLYAAETDQSGTYQKVATAGTAMAAADVVGATNDSTPAKSDAKLAGFTKM